MPPAVVSLQPDSLAVVPEWRRPVVVRFSERISEQQVEDAVMVSPRTSAVSVDRGSREIRVSLRRGWEPGQIYQITVRPLIRDLFNNQIREPIHLVFSTGPEIPPTRLTGLVIDRITGEAEEDVRVEAVRRSDSLVYATLTDSVGGFTLAQIPTGDYLIRAFPDANRNRMMDAFEKRDSSGIVVTEDEEGSVDLSIVLPDTTGPVLASTSVPGTRRIDLRFDDHLDPLQTVDSTTVEIVGPDSLALSIASVSVGAPPAAPDTTGTDSLAASVRALPSQLLVVILPDSVDLVPETQYRVRARGLRNIVGLTGDSEGQFTAPVPPPEPPSDPAVEAEPDSATANGIEPVPDPIVNPDETPQAGQTPDVTPEPPQRL